MTESEHDTRPLLSDGAESPAVEWFRARVRKLIGDRLAPLIADAERDRRFPRQAVVAFGEDGLFRERWWGGAHGDLGRSLVLAEEMGWAGLGGIGVGVSLHLEAAGSLLVRFASTETGLAARDRALSGRAVTCLATSEEHVGSDLAAARTSLTPEDGGWRVQGTKWFVSPGAAADFAIVLCAADQGPALALVPHEQLRVLKRLRTSGLRGLETVRLGVDAVIPDDAVLVRPGRGLPALTWGLLHERLAIAAQVLGGLELAMALAVTHSQRREQFGVPLLDHQALRLRLADLHAQVTLARRGLYATASSLESSRGADLREAAAVKVTLARLSERVVSECMHVFGGMGYLEDETPLARLWRDLRIGRLGAGSDEMMWEMVASGMDGDEEVYEAWLSR